MKALSEMMSATPLKGSLGMSLYLIPNPSGLDDLKIVLLLILLLASKSQGTNATKENMQVFVITYL